MTGKSGHRARRAIAAAALIGATSTVGGCGVSTLTSTFSGAGGGIFGGSKTAEQYGIMSIPTLLMFKNGQIASKQVGFGGKPKLEQWITSAV